MLSLSHPAAPNTRSGGATPPAITQGWASVFKSGWDVRRMKKWWMGGEKKDDSPRQVFQWKVCVMMRTAAFVSVPAKLSRGGFLTVYQADWPWWIFQVGRCVKVGQLLANMERWKTERKPTKTAEVVWCTQTTGGWLRWQDGWKTHTLPASIQMWDVLLSVWKAGFALLLQRKCFHCGWLCLLYLSEALAALFFFFFAAEALSQAWCGFSHAAQLLVQNTSSHHETECTSPHNKRSHLISHDSCMYRTLLCAW